MPMYYFDLYDDETVVDSDGTELINVDAAREHAAGVARELTAHSTNFLDEDWSGWTMRVHDDSGFEVFALAMSDFRDGNSENEAKEGRLHAETGRGRTADRQS
jgi:hypothetical protein